METFKEKVERYMQCDKRTLAELLAMKELVDSNEKPNPHEISQNKYYDDRLIQPQRQNPFTCPPNYGDWTITCTI
jgi:hypothetical protein